MLVALVIAVLAIVVGAFLWKFTYLGDGLREIETATPEELYLKLAEDFNLWNKVINSDDPDDPTNMSWSEHRDTSVEDKIRIIEAEKIGMINKYIQNQFDFFK